MIPYETARERAARYRMIGYTVGVFVYVAALLAVALFTLINVPAP